MNKLLLDKAIAAEADYKAAEAAAYIAADDAYIAAEAAAAEAYDKAIDAAEAEYLKSQKEI